MGNFRVVPKGKRGRRAPSHGGRSSLGTYFVALISEKKAP